MVEVLVGFGMISRVSKPIIGQIRKLVRFR